VIRIISGKFRGKRLYPPASLPAKPTMDIAKEGLFNILHHLTEWENAAWLDLFAGTGNMSYEALSRGVKTVTMVEKDKKCCQFIKKQIQELKTEEQTTLIQQDVWDFLQIKCESPYNIVFIDPPYKLPEQDELITQLFENNFVLPQGLVILEHESTKNFDALPFFKQKRTYGHAAFSFFSTDDANSL
jgi:16S rRNA (guanine(966)-N(2))-methyltransferase RsmD